MFTTTSTTKMALFIITESLFNIILPLFAVL